MSETAAHVASDSAPIDDVNRLQAFFYALQECLRSALGSIRSHRMRSFLTMLGVIIGVGAVIAMVSIGNGAKSMVEAQIAALGENVLLVFSGSFSPNCRWKSRRRLRQQSLTSGKSPLVTRFPCSSSTSPMADPTCPCSPPKC